MNDQNSQSIKQPPIQQKKTIIIKETLFQFEGAVTHAEFQSIQTLIQQFQILLSNNIWFVETGYQTVYGIPLTLLKYVVQTKKLKQLFCSSSKRNISIPSVIFKINFPSLLTINLSKNFITNIQNIVYLDAPNLRSLQLCENLITNTKIFDKAKFSNLKFIKMQCNQYLISIQMTRMDTKQQAIKFCFGHFSDKRMTMISTKRCFFDMTFYAKIKANKFNIDTIYEIKSISQKSPFLSTYQNQCASILRRFDFDYQDENNYQSSSSSQSSFQQ